MKRAYFISGLGADHEVFSRLKLASEVEMHHLPWIKPQEHESLKHYAARMMSSIDEPQSAVLVGLSFGGVVAIEIAKQIAVEKIILISSIKTDDELPPWLKFIGKMDLHKLFPTDKLLSQRELGARFFGCTSPDQRQMLEHLFEQADEETVRWSIDQILEWKNSVIPSNLLHIHGTADTVFPKFFANPDIWIEDGPHFMVYTHAKEMSQQLNRAILG